MAEKIVLGIDPGTRILGYGLIKMVDQKLELMQYGVLNLSKIKDHSLKLKKIYELLSDLILQFCPDEVAMEAPFYGKNVQSMLKLGRVQGVVMAAALSKEIAVIEYAPKKVKQAVTGDGNASKEQIAQMLKNLLQIKEKPEFFDATDAVGVAVCHFYQQHRGSRQTKSWKNFINENPNRLM
ncbi:MAG: crossover junction endodeoxyribonuclease RuvC [Bacteroidetes bacterium]|nr:MAG: crossover junction endodeoxyribonuclease RuvC [Bacteroidota bacterium]